MKLTNSHSIPFLFLIIFVLIYFFFLPKISSYSQWSFNHQYIFPSSNSSVKTISTSNHSTHADVLLIYVYANVHPYAYENLKYFIDNAVREHDGVDYVFILQQTENKLINETQMPSLPKSNAFYFQHENKCFDFGTIGWFFNKYTIGNPWKKETSTTNNSDNNRIFDLRKYKYFIFMNSSVRGPFFPPYFMQFLSDYATDFREVFSWYHVFTNRINDKVKLIGPTISCVPQVHVQSYFLTMDFIGLSILLKDAVDNGQAYARVFGCHASKGDTSLFSEVGSSNLVIQSGYMVSCLLSKYQTIDFSKNNSHRCTVSLNPYVDKSVDGTSLEPYEVVFVKYTGRQWISDAQERAKLYERWMEDVKTKNKTS